MSSDQPYVPEWTYDEEAGAGYLRLRTGEVAMSAGAADTVVVDFDAAWETLGIEVLSSTDAALIDTWLARVRRDAAREALDGLARDFDAIGEEPAAYDVRNWRDTHYPEGGTP